MRIYACVTYQNVNVSLLSSLFTQWASVTLSVLYITTSVCDSDLFTSKQWSVNILLV